MKYSHLFLKKNMCRESPSGLAMSTLMVYMIKTPQEGSQQILYIHIWQTCTI